jgi:hypothetical protein
MAGMASTSDMQLDSLPCTLRPRALGPADRDLDADLRSNRLRQ